MKTRAVVTVAGLMMMLGASWAQSCPKEPPFPNTNDINEVIATCKKYGGTWHGDQYGGCTFPSDWCTKAQSQNTSMPLPRNQQEFATQLFTVAATAWFTGMADKIKTDQQRAEAARLQQQQLLEQRRQQQLRQRQQVVDRLTGNAEKMNDDLQLVFDDSNLGVNRKAGAPRGSPGDLKLVFDDSALGIKHTKEPAQAASAGYGISGLPGIYTNGPVDGNGTAGGYGINGLPGVYTGGPSDPSTAPQSTINRARFASSVENLPGINLGGAPQPNNEDAANADEKAAASGYGIPGLPGTFTSGAREGGTGLSAPVRTEFAKTPTPEMTGQPEMTRQTTPPQVVNDVGQRTGAGVGAGTGAAQQQLQQTADQSQKAAMASTAGGAAFEASQPFDNGTPAVDLRKAKTMVVDPARVRGTNVSAVQPVTMAAPNASDYSGTRPMKGSPGAGVGATIHAGPIASMSVEEERAVTASGIVPKDAETICDYVQKKCRGSIIMQNVNAGATARIAQGNAMPKPMWVKAKSSERPEIAGLVPCDQEKDGRITDPKLLKEALDSIEACKENSICQCKDENGISVLADSRGRLYVSDYDPYAIGCEGDSGAVTGGVFGMASESQRQHLLEINRRITHTIQHGAAIEVGGAAVLPATVFEYDPGADRCHVISLTSDAQVKDYLRRRGVSKSAVAH